MAAIVICYMRCHVLKITVCNNIIAAGLLSITTMSLMNHIVARFLAQAAGLGPPKEIELRPGRSERFVNQ